MKILWVVSALLIFTANTYAQNWSKSFSGGNSDSKGHFLGGSEVLHLIGHKGKLFATVGYWEDGNNIWYGGTNSNIGWAQVIRLDQPQEKWQQDLFLGASYLRPEILKQVVFTKDASGKLLSKPDTLLMAAGYSVNYISSIVTVKSFTRNDSSGIWVANSITQGGFPAGENYSIRDIEIYTDGVTGLERIYATVGTKGLFSGKYNPATPGKVDWISTPEIGPLTIRPLGITTANRTLYFSSGNKLYMRKDGLSPTYSVAHDFSDLSTNINSAVGGIRGLTTIKNPNNNNQALLLMWCPDGQSQGVIYRLEPNGSGGFNRFFEIKLSQAEETFLPGAKVGYLLGAYNEFYEYINPLTLDTLHLVGMEAKISGGGYPTWNGYYKGALFAKRNAQMQYNFEEIKGTIGENDSALVATRCYVQSPFKNENAFYFGGFDPNGLKATNKAWIYKKTQPTHSINKPNKMDSRIAVYPNPSKEIINVRPSSNKNNPYEILTLQGKVVQSGIINRDNNIIDISNLPSSLYLLKTGNEMIKIIKTD